MKKKVFNCHRNKKIVINRTSIESSTTSVMCNKNTYSCMSLYKRWPLINFYTYKKIREIVIALLKRNLISAWPPHAEIWFPHDPPWRNSVKRQVFTIFLEKIIKSIANCDNFIIFLKKKMSKQCGMLNFCIYRFKQEYNFRMGRDFQVQKFLHPVGWKILNN